jgi:hypothetical protein
VEERTENYSCAVINIKNSNIMSELDNLLEELRRMKRNVPNFDAKTVWEGIAQRKDFSEMGFTSLEEFEQWISDNPYANL